MQPTAKFHVSPGIAEFGSIASNSVYSDSNLYRKNNDVFRGFVQFIGTNLVIKDVLAHVVSVTRTGGKGE